MVELNDYSLADVIHAGAETQVIRALHRPTGARVAIKLPLAETPTARLVGRLMHEHEVLVKLIDVPVGGFRRSSKSRAARTRSCSSFRGT